MAFGAQLGLELLAVEIIAGGVEQVRQKALARFILGDGIFAAVLRQVVGVFVKIEQGHRALLWSFAIAHAFDIAIIHDKARAVVGADHLAGLGHIGDGLAAHTLVMDKDASDATVGRARPHIDGESRHRIGEGPFADERGGDVAANLKQARAQLAHACGHQIEIERQHQHHRHADQQHDRPSDRPATDAGGKNHDEFAVADELVERVEERHEKRDGQHRVDGTRQRQHAQLKESAEALALRDKQVKHLQGLREPDDAREHNGRQCEGHG